MRVLLLSQAGVLGGAERSLLDLIDALRDHEIGVVVMGPECPDALRREVLRREVPYVGNRSLAPLLRRAPADEHLRQLLRTAAAARGVARTVRQHAIDIVHANTTAAAITATVWLRRPPTPVLWYLRDEPPTPWLSRWLDQRTGHVACGSPSLASRLRTVAPRARIHVLQPGVSVPQCHGTAAELRREFAPGGEAIVLVVAHWAPWKNHDLALEVAARVVGSRPDTCFLIVGGEPAGSGTSTGYVQRRTAAGLPPRTKLLGERRDIGDLLEASNLLLHVAYPEPFGRVVVEAMHLGRPVVALRGAHGPAEILRDGIDGVLVHPGQPEPLAKAVMTLLANPARCAAMGESGRRRAVGRYSLAQFGSRVASLYGHILGTNEVVE